MLALWYKVGESGSQSAPASRSCRCHSGMVPPAGHDARPTPAPGSGRKLHDRKLGLTTSRCHHRQPAPPFGSTKRRRWVSLLACFRPIYAAVKGKSQSVSDDDLGRLGSATPAICQRPRFKTVNFQIGEQITEFLTYWASYYSAAITGYKTTVDWFNSVCTIRFPRLFRSARSVQSNCWRRHHDLKASSSGCSRKNLNDTSFS